MRVLILGGTQEARELKDAARRASDPRAQAHDDLRRRRGPAALRRRNTHITHIVDATHPFATRISANARHDQRTADPPRAPRLRTHEHEYTYVESLHQARIPADARVFLTTGHHEIEALEHHPAFFLVRALTPPPTLPPDHELILAKGPFSLENERDLIERHRLTHLISKDSGGPDAKLQAARERDLAVILIQATEGRGRGLHDGRGGAAAYLSAMK